MNFIESRSHIAPKPTPRNSKLSATDTNQTGANVDIETEIVPTVDRSPGDYSETKKFWLSLECEQQEPPQVPPVPKPRSQSQAFASQSISFEEQEFGQSSITDDSISQSSSKISSEAQVEKSETYSSHIEIKSSFGPDEDSCLENESFPQFSEKCDTDSIDLKQHKNEEIFDGPSEQADQIDSSKYRMKEREDILDDDDYADYEAKRSAASFYIGEKSGNIITKSAAEKRFDDDTDERQEISNQEDRQTDELHEIADQEEIEREVRFNLEPEEIKISYNPDDTKQADIMNYEQNVDSTQIGEKSDSESSEKIEYKEPYHTDNAMEIGSMSHISELPIQEHNVEVEQKELEGYDFFHDSSALIHSSIESGTVSMEKNYTDLLGFEESELPKQTIGHVAQYDTETTMNKNEMASWSEKRPLVIHSPVEQPGKNVVVESSDLILDRECESTQPIALLPSSVEPVKGYYSENESQSEDISSKQQHEEDALDRLGVIHRRRTKVTPKTRWSATDPDYSSAGSYNDSETSRPCSSDVENLYVSFPNSSAEYQTALDASTIPGSTEYHTAASTFDHSGNTISSHESMKSFSESSGNLGSVEVSEASETLVASTAEDKLSDTQEKDLDFHLDENEQQLSSLDTFTDAAFDDLDDVEQEVKMKRSHEMIFSGDANAKKLADSLTSIEKVEIIERKVFEEDIPNELKGVNEFGSSLGDTGSYLSMSLSSNTSNVDTIVENIPNDLIGSLNSSTVDGYEFGPFTNDSVTSTSFEENLIMTTSTVQEGDIVSVNTQITTEAAGNRPKGHRRNDSQTFLGNLEMSKLSQESSDSSLLDDEMIIHDVPDDDMRESDDSDYDRYETEYTRAFKTPTDRQRKKRTMAAQIPEGELERKKSVPNIETIVEDAEEIELEKMRVQGQVSQNMLDYSNIPDITITDDPTKYVSSDDDEPEDTQHAADEIVISSNQNSASPIEQSNDVPKISKEQYEQLIEQQYKTQIDKELKSDSPDSFEMVEHEQPDISDEFVIIEEVAKEAHELMSEGQSVSIRATSYAERTQEIDKMLVKSAPAATNEGSTLLQGRHDLAFEFEDSPSSGAGTESSEDGGNGIESSRKWVEMQLAEQAQNLRYPYDVDRGVLEDIKEEDTDFDVGSSRISSFKDSYSSNDYETAAVRRHQSREQDNVSMNSLQEFESLEQAISLENRRFCSSSHDSLSNGSFPKRGLRSIQADEISLASLHDFEGLENACLEATLLEIKAKEEHALLLSRSDESNKSGKSVDNKQPAKVIDPVVVTNAEIVNATTTFSQDGLPRDVQPNKFNEPDEVPYSMEVSTDSLEIALKQAKQTLHGKNNSRHGSIDSLEISKSCDAMTSSVDSIEMSKDGTTAKSDSDSIEQMVRGEKRDSIDSIDAQYVTMNQSVHTKYDSFDANTLIDLTSSVTTSGSQVLESRTITTSVASSSGYGGGISKDISSDSLNIGQSEPELLITSTDSLDHTSSTFATYYNETDSQMTMSGSMTSCDSNTLIDNLDTATRPESFHMSYEKDATENVLLRDIDIDEKFGARMTSTITPTSAHKSTSGSSDVDNS